MFFYILRFDSAQRPVAERSRSLFFNFIKFANLGSFFNTKSQIATTEFRSENLLLCRRAQDKHFLNL